MRIENDIKLDFKDVLIRPKRSTLKSRSQVTLARTFTFKHSPQTWTGVPIAIANMDTTGTFEIAAAASKHQLLTCMHKHYTLDQWTTFARESPDAIGYVAASCGSSVNDFNAVKDILAAIPEIKFICLDVANGYSEFFVDCVKRTREAFPNHIIIAGNVVTCEMTEELILSGADVVKVSARSGRAFKRRIQNTPIRPPCFMAPACSRRLPLWFAPPSLLFTPCLWPSFLTRACDPQVGIGPGSVCTTRKQTGVGYPQLSAVIECADAAHGLGGHVVSDGGCTCPGDFSKAFGAGGDFVMTGGMFAGHDESGGELVEKEDGSKCKLFYGMSSATAMEKHAGGVAEYRSSEGKTVSVPYRGPVSNTIMDILGGMRSSCTYVGASTLKEISKRTTFIRVTQQLNHVFGTADMRQPGMPAKK